MKSTIVRLQEIKIYDFKNIDNGVITFPCYRKNTFYERKSEVLGIYGQNGSGKTAVVEAMKIFKILCSGDSLPTNITDYIQVNKNITKLEYIFYIEKEEARTQLFYEVILNKDGNITEELSAKFYNKDKGKWARIKSLISTKERLEKKKYKDLELERTIAIRNKKSAIFSSEVLENLKKGNKAILIGEEEIRLLRVLQRYSRVDLSVITHEGDGLIAQNIKIPINIRHEKDDLISCGKIVVPLDGSGSILLDQYKIFLDTIEKINIVLEKLIPGMKVDKKEHGKETNKNNQEEMRIELLSNKNGIIIPLRYESEGIKKIISLLNTLMAVYNIPNYCLVIDELDAGIFEYLLGEILKVISETGKGQLIFTSHNLRPLEVLTSEEIYFSTTNPKNKFIKFSGIKENNNLRNVFIRSVTLGGQPEEIYKETDEVDIARALRISGREKND